MIANEAVASSVGHVQLKTHNEHITTMHRVRHRSIPCKGEKKKKKDEKEKGMRAEKLLPSLCACTLHSDTPCREETWQIYAPQYPHSRRDGCSGQRGATTSRTTESHVVHKSQELCVSAGEPHDANTITGGQEGTTEAAVSKVHSTCQGMHRQPQDSKRGSTSTICCAGTRKRVDIKASHFCRHRGLARTA